MIGKILIIEDDDGMRRMEKSLLEMAGYEIFESDNAKDGINLAISRKPDVILMDVKLPSKKRGIGAARILRDTEETRNTPIIFVTGYTFGEDTSEIKNIPNTRYVTKPFEIKVLLDEIKNCLGQ